eukprot:350337-Chlamydomonas_euryale.AAC.5
MSTPFTTRASVRAASSAGWQAAAGAHAAHGPRAPDERAVRYFSQSGPSDGEGHADAGKGAADVQGEPGSGRVLRRKGETGLKGCC